MPNLKTLNIAKNQEIESLQKFNLSETYIRYGV